MRIFVTGASGYIGKAIVRELVKGGHQVTGLVRGEDKARLLVSLGAQPLLGNLRDPGGYREALSRCEAAVHVALEPSAEAVALDRATVEAFLAAAHLESGPKTLAYMSGVLVLGATGDTPADERMALSHPFPGVAWRVEHEQLLLQRAGEGVSAAVIRPGYVYGGETGTIGRYFQSAVERGAAEYVGDGRNRMAMVYLDDVATLFRLAVEKRGRGVFHAVDEVQARIVEMAKAASEAAGKGGAVRSIPLDEARQQMGVWADAECVDLTAVAPRARELGWRPSQTVLPGGIRQAFAEWKASRR